VARQEEVPARGRRSCSEEGRVGGARRTVPGPGGADRPGAAALGHRWSGARRTAERMAPVEMTAPASICMDPESLSTAPAARVPTARGLHEHWRHGARGRWRRLCSGRRRTQRRSCGWRSDRRRLHVRGQRRTRRRWCGQRRGRRRRGRRTVAPRSSSLVASDAVNRNNG